MPVSVSRLAFSCVLNGLAVVLCVRLFLARAYEQPSLMFAFGGGDQAFDPDTCFAIGREHVPKLRSVTRITSVFFIDALLRHAANCMSPRREGGARSVGVRLVRKAKIFPGAGERTGGLCCGGGRVGARAFMFLTKSFERAWVSALAALARGRRTCARALTARAYQGRGQRASTGRQTRRVGEDPPAT